MGELTPLVERALDELAAPRPGPDRWEEIESAAVARRHRLSAWGTPSLVLAPFAVAALIVVAILAWPFTGGPRGTLLERAAAAIGDGPILHVVVQSGFGATEVDLATGEKTVMHGEEELWYDPLRGVHDVTRFAGVVQADALYPPGRVAYLDNTLAFLATDYRRALAEGTAKALGEDSIDGKSVHWIRVDTQMLPEVADGKLHEWAHDVAVSTETLKPVATRETRDGQLSPDGISRILSVETLGRGEGDFTVSLSGNGIGVRTHFELTGSLTADEANSVLGRTMLWPGPTFNDLPLSRIAKLIRSEGYDRTTGRSATTYTGIMLFYGPSTGGGIGQRASSVPYLQISETLTPDDQLHRGVRNYTPPEGKLLVVGNVGVMQSHGIHLLLETSNAETLIVAARSLVPNPD